MRDQLNVVIVLDARMQADELLKALSTTAGEVKATLVSSALALDDALQGRRPDLVVGYCGIPAFSCEEVLEIIRQRLPGIATILVSTGFEAAHARRLMQAGADELLLTEQLPQLRWAAERALDRAHERDAPPGAPAPVDMRPDRMAVLSCFFDSAIEAIVCTDQDQRILAINPAAEALFGYKMDEIFGQSLERLIPDRYHEIHATYVSRFVAGPDAGRQMASYRPVMARHRSGREFRIEATIAKAQSPGGGILTVVLRQPGEDTDPGYSRSVLAAIVESAEDAIVGKTLDGIIRTWSPGAQRIFGYAPEEIIGRHISVLFPPDRLGEERMIIDRVERGERVESYESRRLRKDGHEIDVSLTISPIRSADGTIIGASKIARDITQRLAAERRERRQVALYTAMSQTNQALVHTRDPAALYREICRVCVEHGRAVLAFVVTVRDGRARPVAAAGNAADYLKGFTIPLSADRAEGRGPIATALRQGAPYICNDFHADPATAPWRARAARLGTQSMAAVPFRRGGQAEGVLVLHTSEKNYFDEQMVRLLTEMADDVSFGLDNFDRETARLETELALRRSEASLASAQQRAQLGNFDVDLATGSAQWSQQMFRLFDVDPHEGAPPPDRILERIHPEDRARYSAAYEQALRFGTSSTLEIRLDPARAAQRWLHVNLQGCADASGKVISLSGAVQDVTERKLSELRILHLGTHDVLTDLPNRLLMRDRIAQALANARRGAHQVGVLFLDLDRFKFINDAYGHPFGDALIRAAAERLSATVRANDSVSRTGGDEFLVLLVDLHRRADAYVAVQKVLECFRVPFVVEDRQVVVTASIGVSLYPQDGEDADALIGNADIAMYRSKSDGRNTYQFFSAQMSEETRQRAQLESELRHALERHELALVYQPKVDLSTGRIFGCEALVRWQHPHLGAVSPGRFIPIAEETGLIVPIGDWILREACRQNKAWQDAGLRHIVMSINLSTRQFRQQDVTDWVRNVLVEVDLDPATVELELTESLIADDTEGIVGAIRDLKRMGVKLSIDDFGTGFSSLAYLKRFRVDTLKIDQSFIRNLLTEPDDATIALAIIALAHSLRLTVIAEGVETIEQCRMLRASGCDAIQGYLFSRPVCADAMAELLRTDAGLDPAGG
jgi:diguanylate cyclase (GGDEF)-like protein/PAS domain S-box-containing protein